MIACEEALRQDRRGPCDLGVVEQVFDRRFGLGHLVVERKRVDGGKREPTQQLDVREDTFAVGSAPGTVDHEVDILDAELPCQAGGLDADLRGVVGRFDDNDGAVESAGQSPAEVFDPACVSMRMTSWWRSRIPAIAAASSAFSGQRQPPPACWTPPITRRRTPSGPATESRSTISAVSGLSRSMPPAPSPGRAPVFS